MKKLLLLLILTIPLTLIGQDKPCDPQLFSDNLLDKLVGEWKITGQIGGDPVENNFDAKWVLNHQFLELNFLDVNPEDYAAKVFIGYDCISERYVVHWLDSFGSRYSETLGYGIKKDENIIEFRFEYPNAPLINKFSYDSKADIWTFFVTTKNKEGNWVEFGTEKLTRKIK